MFKHLDLCELAVAFFVSYQNKKAPQKRLKGFSMFSDPDWIRTNDPQLRRLLLYPTELRDLKSAAKINKNLWLQISIFRLLVQMFNLFLVPMDFQL